MDSSELQLVLYKSFTDTESIAGYIKSAVSGLASCGDGSVQFGLELVFAGVKYSSGQCDLAFSYPIKNSTMVHCSGTLWSSREFPEQALSLLTELIMKRAAGHTRCFDRAADTAVRILGITFHDVRNTLGSVSGIAQLVEMDAADKPEVLSSVQDIIGIINKFDETATTTMRLLRGQEIVYARDVFSLSDMCSQVLKRSGRVYQLSSIQLESEIQPGIICTGDEGYVKEIFTELLTNAASALDGLGGKITVSVSERGGNVEICVGQSCSPVPLELQEYIFLPFFTTKEKGRGMGLTRIARFLKDWGGRIELASAQDQPVRFVVTLPTTLP